MKQATDTTNEKEWDIPSDHGLRGDYSNKAADWTVPQDYAHYTSLDQDLWRRLYRRQSALLKDYAASEVIAALQLMDCSQAIPNLEAVSEQLIPATGWRLVAVPGLIPEEIFFAHLAERRFPVTTWLRKPEEFDYLVEPDIFHDFFGHVPLLFNPVFADYMQAYGFKGAEAQRLGMTSILARLYWYMVEFGLIRQEAGLRAYGAGILSSGAETVFCIDDASPNRIGFALERVLRTNYRIDDFQETYFVLENYEELFAATQRDFRPLYAQMAKLDAYAPDMVLNEDKIYHRGTGLWKQKRQRSAA